LHRRNEQPDEHADDRDDDQQFNQREAKPRANFALRVNGGWAWAVWHE
jgi:hypothetical protein